MVHNELIDKAFKLGFESYFGLMIGVNPKCYHLWMADLQKWLREVHNIHISVTKVYECSKSPARFKGWNIFIAGKDFETNYEINNTLVYKYYNTYEEALEASLKEALKLIP